MGIKELHDRVISHLAGDGNFIICAYRKEKFLASRVYTLTHEREDSLVFSNYNGEERLMLRDSLDAITIEANGIKYRFGDGDTDCGEIIFVSQVKI